MENVIWQGCRTNIYWKDQLKSVEYKIKGGRNSMSPCSESHQLSLNKVLDSVQWVTQRSDPTTIRSRWELTFTTSFSSENDDGKHTNFVKCSAVPIWRERSGEGGRWSNLRKCQCRNECLESRYWNIGLHSTAATPERRADQSSPGKRRPIHLELLERDAYSSWIFRTLGSLRPSGPLDPRTRCAQLKLHLIQHLRTMG